MTHVASHFFREEVPRIAYNNPKLVLEIERKEKTKEEQWDPQMTVEFREWPVRFDVQKADRYLQ